MNYVKRLGGLDEAPFADKNIEDVMKSQKDLVEIVGRLIPRIVKNGVTPKDRRLHNHGLDEPDVIVGE